MAVNIWKIALFGTDTYHVLDSNYEIDISSLDTPDLGNPAWPEGDVDWLTLSISAGKPEFVEDDEVTEVPGGIEIIRSTQRLTLNVIVEPVEFPDEMDIFVAYKNLKKKRYIYLYNISYPDTQMPLHAAGKAVAVNIKKSIEHDFDHGVKTMNIEIRKIGIE